MTIVAVVLLLTVVGLVAALVSPRSRRRTLRYSGFALGGALAAYFVVRGIFELWLIDFAEPDTYRNDWGGPSLVGVLAVHAGPAAVIVAAILVRLGRWRRLRLGPTTAAPVAQAGPEGEEAQLLGNSGSLVVTGSERELLPDLEQGRPDHRGHGEMPGVHGS